MSIFCLQRTFMWCIQANNLTKRQTIWCDWNCIKST